MTNYGAKFTQVGTDIKKAADHEVHFSSEWPNLKIMLRGHLSSNVALGTTTALYKHNLGFVPAFLSFEYSTSAQDYEIFRSTFSVDREYLYWDSPGVGGSGGRIDIAFGVDIFAVDITKNFRAPQDNSRSTSTQGTEKPVGIKVAFDGNAVDSPYLQEMVVNTDARCPLVHAVAAGEGNAPGPFTTKNFVYTHDLDYNPMFMAYVENAPGKYYLANNYAGLNTSGSTITVVGLTGTKKASIVVLKDPFNASENTQVITV